MLKHFHFWCQRVIPLVYDDSLSYYEILCKVVHKLNELITASNNYDKQFEELSKELEEINDWIENFNYDKILDLISCSIATFVMPAISDSGYFVIYMPGSWKNVTFNTTGYDINLEIQPEYGHLVLSY